MTSQKTPNSELPLEYRQIFEKLKDQVDNTPHGGLKRYSIASIESFAHHYLMALSMLTQMRGNPNWHQYIPMCQRLLINANILLYPEEDISLKRVWLFFWDYIPAQLWESRYFHLASFLIVLVTTVMGFIIVIQNFEMAPVFVPTGLRSSHEIEAYLFSKTAQHDMLTAGRDASMGVKALFATQLMVHNIQVALTCFVSGFLFGIPTLLILVETGLMLGALPALFYGGDIVGIGAWLLPHGVPEISAIIFSGGAGLQLGLAVLKPVAGVSFGTLIKNTLKRVSGTVGLCVVLLVWAGLVESFVRQSELSYEARYEIAFVSLLPLLLVWIRAFLAHRKLRNA